MSKPVTGLTQFATIGGNEPASVLDANFQRLVNAANDVATYSNYAPDTGAVNAYVIDFGPSITFSLTVGVEVIFKPANTNNTAATLNVAGTGAKNIVTQSGLTTIGGELVAGRLVKCAYDGTNWQLTAAPQVQASDLIPAANAQLQWVSATQLKLFPYNGNKLTVNGHPSTVPNGGLSIANTGIYLEGVAGQSLSASTKYYLYAWDNGGNLQENFSVTAYETDVTSGMPVKIGASPFTLVGMVVTNASAQFTAPLTRSWFNDPGVAARGVFTSDHGLSTGGYSEIASEIRVNFAVWAGEIVVASVVAQVAGNVGTQVISSALNIDGTTNQDGSMIYTCTGISSDLNIQKPQSGTWNITGLNEGLHYATLFGKVSAGNGTWSGGAAPDRCTVAVRLGR